MSAPTIETGANSHFTPTERELSLSDLNPLFHGLDLGNPGALEAFRTVSLGLIKRHGGLEPNSLKAMVVSTEGQNPASEPRLISRWVVDALNQAQLDQLQLLTKDTYGVSSKTITNSEGGELPPIDYPYAERPAVSELLRSHYKGWYMGANTQQVNNLHRGLFVFRDVGVTNASTFLEKSQSEQPGYLVEIREGDMYQTDLLNLVVQTGVILGTGERVHHGSLLHEGYQSLMRMALREGVEGVGVEDLLKPIRDGLILPLANPELAEAIGQKPESVIFCGVPGTGKSLAARRLMIEDTGTLIIPMDPLELSKDLLLIPGHRKILSRIIQVMAATGKPVVLQLDDVEKLLEDGSPNNSTLLNLMAGVAEWGFRVMASTNEPERINPALLQPERFGIQVFCPLPSEEARRQILEQHSPYSTLGGGVPLFSSTEARELIMGLVSELTDDFTPRQVAKVATNAKAILLGRVASKTGKTQGLTEEDLEGEVYTVDDWKEAFAHTLRGYNRKETARRSDEIRRFLINPEDSTVGFRTATIPGGARFDALKPQIAFAETTLSSQQAGTSVNT